jgi:hypothetical protein
VKLKGLTPKKFLNSDGTINKGMVRSVLDDVNKLKPAAPNKTLFTNRLKYRFVGDATQHQKLLDDLAGLKSKYGPLVHLDEVGKANGRIAYGTFDPATGKITIFRGGDDLTVLEELLHWKFHNERLDMLGWSQADFLKRWNDPSDSVRDAFRRQYHDAAEAEIVRILRDVYGWIK